MTKDQIRTVFSKNLLYVRQQLKLSQTQFASVLEINQKKLASIEEGRSLCLLTAISLSRHIKVSLETVLLNEMGSAQTKRKLKRISNKKPV